MEELKNNKKSLTILVGLLCLIIVITISNILSDKSIIKKVKKLKKDDWQAEVSFPDWKEYVEDSLAMNSMYSFDYYKDQGEIYLTVNKKVKSFDLFVNNKKINTKDIKDGIYKVNISKMTLNGKNTIQVTNISPKNLKNAIKVNIPYPTVIEGTINEVGFSKESFDLINNIITSDINNGFSSAELAVIKDGKMVYQNAWGLKNSYNKKGEKLNSGEKVNNDTLYDLASNTKMYSAMYAIQYLLDKGEINLDDKVVDIIGNDFVNKTLEIKFSTFDNYPGLNIIKHWKSNITIKNLLMHQAGFPDSGHYHNQKFDTVNQKLDNDADNVLFVDDSNKEKALDAINKTPLMYEPGTNIMYSDIDYMLLGLIVEKKTDKDLNTFLKETFWEPIGLKNITYNPLDNGFKKNDCAATELNGNTRDGLVDFPNVRKDTIKCEVHDEESYYIMGGISGHAGLFSSATDLAKLAYIMLTGGYENNKFFSKNTRDIFISPQGYNTTNYGIGWWREGDNRRVWYFGTESPESTIGHQGFTGTLTMIDFDNNMVIVYLTNSINTPIENKSGLETANDFSGRYYTSSTLGFVPQIIYTGLNKANPNEALKSLVKDMLNEKDKLIKEKKYNKNHAIYKARKAIEDIIK